MKLFRPPIALFLLGVSCIAQRIENNTAELITRAKSAEQANNVDAALELVAKANSLLEQNAPLSVQHAQALDYYVFLLAQSRQNSNSPRDDWHQIALPFAAQALSIVEQSKEAHHEDLATALETKAESLGQTPEAKRLWKRSTEIRRHLVDELIRIKKSTPCPAKLNLEQPQSLPSAPYQRSAVLSFVVDSSGRPTQIRLIRSIGFGLDEEAAKALRCWQFKPGTAGGHPVYVPATVQINFRVFWPAVEEEDQRTKQPTGTVQETIVLH